MVFRKFRQQRVVEPDNARAAMDTAMYFLKFRARSEAEVAERLKLRGYSPACVDRTVNRLRELKLLDDAVVASQWVESRRRSGLGEFRIRQKLRERGIPKDLIEKSVKDTAEGRQPGGKTAETDRAWKALQKRAERLKKAEPQTLYRRLGGFLSRRGFSADVVHEALERYFSRLRSRAED